MRRIQLRTGEIVHASEDRTLEVRIGKVWPLKMRTREVRSLEVRVAQERLLKLSVHEDRSFEPSTPQMSIA